MKKQNIFTLFLSLLKVRHTSNYSNKYFDEHPNKNNLLGISQMLSEYNIENIAFRVDPTKESLQEVEPPFLVDVKDGFSLVTGVNNEQIELYIKEEKLLLPIDSFIRMWSGIILVGEANENSIEPKYAQNKKQELIGTFIKSCLSLSILIVIIKLATIGKFYSDLGLLTATLLNGMGIYICYLLLLKQLKIKSKSADKLCSLFLHQQDCNNILDSKASKIFNTFSWSEIGLGYFLTNTIIIFSLPSLIPYVTFINICALPYTVWSIWYQYKVAKQWCGLCILTQVLIWLLFINNLYFHLIEIPVFNFFDIVLTGSLYTASVLSINLLTTKWVNSAELTETKQKLNNLKADEDIFLYQLTKQEKSLVDRKIGILIGNPQAENIITVVSNPHCNPCAAFHKELEKLLSKTDSYCIQYILTSFSEELEISSKLLIAMYQKLPKKEYLDFLNHWYDTGKQNYQKYYEKHSFDTNDPIVLNEFNLQKEWIKKTKVFYTPKIFFNGWEMPENYTTNDLIYFQNIHTPH